MRKVARGHQRSSSKIVSNVKFWLNGCVIYVFWVISGREIYFLGFWDHLTHLSPRNPRWTPFLIDKKIIFPYHLDMCNLWFLDDFESKNVFLFFQGYLTYTSEIDAGRRFDFVLNNLG